MFALGSPILFPALRQEKEKIYTSTHDNKIIWMQSLQKRFWGKKRFNQTSKIMYVNTPPKRSSKLIRTGMGGTKWKSEDILKKQTGFWSKLAIHIGYYFFICGHTGLLLTAKLRFALKNDCKSLQQWRVCFH